MSRWDYDTVFYRVFCITLLAVAFTFTVILTNVFVDIDRVLSRKGKGGGDKSCTDVPLGVFCAFPPASVYPSQPSSLKYRSAALGHAIDVNILPEDKSEDVYEDKDYQDSNDLYRSKRSLETQDPIFHVKDPKVKKLLTNHLANLLDELDERDNNNKKVVTIENNDYNAKDKRLENVDKINKKYNENANLEIDKKKVKEGVVGIKEYLKQNKGESKSLHDKMNSHKDYRTELLHLAMHNVILQGIIENTDLDDVYKKVADLVKDFENDHFKLNKDELKNLLRNEKKIDKHPDYSTDRTSSDELKHTKGSVTQRDSESKRSMKIKNEATTENSAVPGTTIGKPKDHNVIIKTIIDITAMSNGKSNKDTDSNAKDKINGIIKLIYNGNVIRFKRIDDDNNTNSQIISNKLDIKTTANKDVGNIESNYIGKKHEAKLHASNQNQSYYQKIFYDYLKKIKVSDSSEQDKIFSSKRLKRHIKIRYEKNKTTVKPKPKKDDDELFVEIETHFDSKGTKGEKKKKLIRDLIEKIQNAIHSDNKAHKKKQKHWHVKKRIQDPLSRNSAAALINKLMIPLETLAHRHLDPISKAVPAYEDMPIVTSGLGHNNWGTAYSAPKFFGKSINSAEMNTVDTDYNKVMKHNGVPQRLQKPLNTDMSDEVFQDSKVVDLGNIKFLMKDVDGSGFSIGFNQYTDEAPDPETMKLFSGLENIIQTYHQQYDQESTIGTRQQNAYDNAKNITPNEVNNQEQTDQSDQHVIQRRSIQNSEEIHPYNYRIVYGHNFLPYKNYNEILQSKKPSASKVTNMKVYRMKNTKNTAFIIDENVFEKDLKPAEILSIADLLQRKKRSVKVKKISNVKIKSKINRYINTKKMASKSIFLNKKHTKRSKRQIEKIRIIARDLPQHAKSEEDNIFMVSDEKLFADRALVREVEMPEMEPNDKIHSMEHYDMVPSQKEEEPYDIVTQTQKVNEDPEEHFDILSPYLYNVNPFDNQNEFSRRARHNSLMSKYPHIIMEDSPNYANRGEEFSMENIQQQYSVEATTIPALPTLMPSPNEQEITDLISPPKGHSNYRVSVKIRPKNSTNMSGFKEVHTSINKSYNKNGLMYTSLVNVSQLSKVEKVNKTLSRRDNDENRASEQKVNLKQQQDLIKTLIQQHKHRLDVQLKHLQIEKQKLETMNLENPENIVLDKAHFTNTKKVRKQLNEEAKTKLTQEATTTEATTQPFATEPSTTLITTTEFVKTTTEDTMKTKMIESIERNENITNELLKKIDQNTGVLKIFLGKLIATIDVPSQKATEMTTLKTEDCNSDCSNTNNESCTNNGTKPVMNDHNTGNTNHTPFNFDDYHYMPSMLFRNMARSANNSNGIPFVYAVQHPYGVIPNRDTMASMVYHGHIHTNTMNDNNLGKRDMKAPIKVVLKDKIKVVTDKKNIDVDFWKPQPGEKVLHDFVVSKNNSRFFLDDTRNDFTVVPRDKAKNAFPLVLVNATKV